MAYDDAGFLEVGNLKVVVSCDGIVETVAKENPWLAGYYCVITNVGDIAAKGARPRGFVNIISSSSSSIRRRIAEGIKYGLDKYGLILLKGHTHPDTSYDAVDGAAIGVSEKIIPGTTAKAYDSLILAVDLDGKFESRGWLKTFDSVSSKSTEKVLHQLNSMVEISEKGLANAAKDVSGPGIVGTIAMLCESSHVGAIVNLQNIPLPRNVTLADWLITYPSTGFIIATSKPKECLQTLRNHDLAAAEIGKITEDKRIWLSLREKSALFLDLNYESVFGMRT
ncbi:MAG: AIR synthase-related protein [Nitrososphaerota archaeon]|nr:AIR synthase-related protein [Nitrososphaerota archaeon]